MEQNQILSEISVYQIMLRKDTRLRRPGDRGCRARGGQGIRRDNPRSGDVRETSANMAIELGLGLGFEICFCGRFALRRSRCRIQI